MCCEIIFQVHCLRAYNTKYILITRHYYKEIGRICDFRGEVRETVREMQWVTARVSRRTQHGSIESHPKIVRIKPVFWWAVFNLHKRVFLSCEHGSLCVNGDGQRASEPQPPKQRMRAFIHINLCIYRSSCHHSGNHICLCSNERVKMPSLF